MIKDPISYFNTLISGTGYFNNVLCLADKIEKDSKSYPAIYNSNNEYEQINLDVLGSVCYWRKNGDVTFSKQPSETSIGTEYTNTVPLKWVGFMPKDSAVNDAYFSDNICLEIISLLTTNNSALKPMLKAKKAGISATKYNTNGKAVASDEYEGMAFEPRYTHAYFSIEFDLIFITNSQCFTPICNG